MNTNYDRPYVTLKMFLHWLSKRQSPPTTVPLSTTPTRTINQLQTGQQQQQQQQNLFSLSVQALQNFKIWKENRG